MNAIGTLLGRTEKAWEPPTFEQPMPVSGKSLEPLGVDGRGRHWYASQQWGELAEAQLLDERYQILPNGPIYEEERFIWRTFTVHRPGTFATPPIPRRPKPVPALRPVDLLGLSSLASKVGTGGERHLRGVDAIKADIVRKGSEVRLTPDGQDIVLWSDRGRPSPGVIELFQLAYALLRADAMGQRLTCRVHQHKTPVEATSLAVGDVPWCEGGAS